MENGCVFRKNQIGRLDSLTGLIDIHNHMLYGIDDGPPSQAIMLDMLKIAYDDGIRGICLTPHFYNPMIPKIEKKSLDISPDDRIDILKKEIARKYPGMRLWKGNELFFHHECLSKLESGACLTLGNSRYVLVEFFPDEDFKTISNALQIFLKSGYISVLAHAERYKCLYKKIREINALSDAGVKIQVNSSSVLGFHGMFCKHFIHKLLQLELVDLIASDAHNNVDSRPILSDCFMYVKRKYGVDYAKRLFCTNALRILG